MLIRVLRFLFTVALTAVLLWALGTSFKVKGNALPPLGSFFNPISGFWRNAEPLTGKATPDTNIPGLKAPVNVAYDDLLVPHIFAQSLEDAVRAQGYITAQNRLWQMDIGVRKAAGRLSEVLGERTLEADKMARREGLLFAAENDVIGWKKSPESMRLLDAYTEGVNAWISQLKPGDYPIEFKLLGYKPEPWNVLKTALVTENMAKTLCARETDFESSNTLRHFQDRGAFDYLYPEWYPAQTPIVPDTGQWAGLQIVAHSPTAASATISLPQIGDLSSTDAPRDKTMPYEVPIEGSNNFALSGSKTASGRPILCNDPHLGLTLPSVWYSVQLHSPEVNAYGVTLPGVPGIVIGFNENAAWGMTNAGHDVADWMRIKWSDGTRKTYLMDGKTVSAKVQVEEIRVKGKPAVFDTVHYTRWGPMTFDNDPAHPLYDYAYRWITHEVPERNPVETFLGLAQSKDYNDYAAALPGYDCPAQNFIFASRSGDIAIRVQGRLPVRAPEQGRFLLDGSSWLNGWQGYIPESQLPTMRNPSRGFVYSANQQSTPPTYPYYYTGIFEDDRSRRIFERLSTLKNATADSMKAMQLDNYNHRAADALPLMLASLDPATLTEAGRGMVRDLGTWNFYYDHDKTEPTIFQAWFDSCYKRSFDELYAVSGGHDDILFPEAWRFIDLLKNDSTSKVFDHPATPLRETARNIVQEAFSQVERDFAARPDLKMPWGKAKKAEIKHLAMIPAFGRLNLDLGGHGNSPNAMQKTFGPSWRMIVELNDPVKAIGVYPGGQSGNPGSPYYDNMLDYWATGQYYDLVFLKKADEASDRIKQRQVLSPKN